jgi:hypothetical protein
MIRRSVYTIMSILTLTTFTGCDVSDNTSATDTSKPCNLDTGCNNYCVSGVLWYDKNNNGLLEAGEDRFKNQLVKIENGSEVEFDPDVAFPWDLIRDPDGGKFVVAYLDEIGGSGGNYDGSLITITMTSSFPNLAIGSTYYVQDDGTLSTTSSSVTAGKAIANTTLLLKG